jgi:large conductance mechanosensitive channel
MLKEFRNFAIKGNVMDMAVGIIIGTAFGKIVTSLVTDLIMPPIGWITGGVDFSNMKIVLKEAVGTSEAVSINYGNFINSILSFVIITFSIFFVIKQMNNLREKFHQHLGKEAKVEVEEDISAKEMSEQTKLLREIRDSLKHK